MTLATERRAAALLNARREGNRMDDETPFFPRGAVAFFIAMMLFYGAIWLLLMGIMVSRG